MHPCANTLHIMYIDIICITNSRQENEEYQAYSGEGSREICLQFPGQSLMCEMFAFERQRECENPVVIADDGRGMYMPKTLSSAIQKALVKCI